MIGDAFARLSTGLKMLIILSAALLPLGLIAVVASMEAASSARSMRGAEARAILSAASRLIEDRIGDDMAGLRRAGAQLNGASAADCREALAPLTQAGLNEVPLALIDARGRLICSVGNMAPVLAEDLPGNSATRTSVSPDGQRLRFAVRIVPDGMTGVGEYGPGVIQRIVRPVLIDRYPVNLREGSRTIALNGPGDARGELAARHIDRLAGGPAEIELLVRQPPISAVEVLTALLPILMWLAAAIIGWMVVDRLLLMPLGQMQRAIAGYRGSDGPLRLPPLTTPALEIQSLGDAFQQVTNRLTAHEAELEQGLARQIRLTREVHHRVKNNLQVVSSLINLHARGADDPAVIHAYASIQRRVDALAVVHRNHYAELEENRGVGLRALIGELAANLRATAPPRAAHMAITLDLIPAYASQDVAVPVAFLITEIVELAMECDPEGRIAILLTATDQSDRALLTLVAPGLSTDACADHRSTPRYLRVTEGLSRQLRSRLLREPEHDRISIEIAVTPAPAIAD